MMSEQDTERQAIFAAAWEAMRERAEAFEAPREACLRTESMISVGLPACHGAGHAGALG